MTIVHIYPFTNKIVINAYDNIEFNTLVRKLKELREELDKTHEGFIRFEGKE